MRKTVFIYLILLLTACNSETKEKQEESFQRVEEKHIEYYDNGLKKVEGLMVNGERHGKWIYYYDNGFVWSEGKFWYGKRDGYSIVYYKDGRTKLRGEYENGLKIGKWEIYDSKGKLAKVVNMDELLSSDDSLKLELK
jgi:antitoxin component YwqK of YwqJK toxin-antitoxin module